MQNLNLIRCFLALELDREAITEIEEIQKLIKTKNFFFGKLTEPENLHLTLKFIGEISEEKLEEIKKQLKTIKFPEFEVSLAELGTFIDRYNSILWIKLNNKQIWDLHEKLDSLLEPLGFKKETRFMSHITLARMKKIINKPLFLEYIKNLKHREIKFKVKEFILKKSELKSDGPVYTNLEKYELENTNATSK